MAGGCPVDFASDVTLNNPTVNGGEFNRPTITMPTLLGTITVDEAAQQSLVDILQDALAPIVAETFRNCQGLRLDPDTRIATCDDLAAAIAASCCGQGGGGGGGGDTITNMTYTAGTGLLRTSVTYSDGTTPPKDWDVIIPSGGGGGGDGDTITNMTYDSGTGLLRISVTYADGVTPPKNWDVTIPPGAGSGIILSPWKPAVSTMPVLPTTVFADDREAGLIGAPLVWGSVTINDTEYIVPLYQPIANP